MAKTKTVEKITIPEKARVRVVWGDNPAEYTKERQKRIQTYFNKKYKTDNVQVVFKPKKIETEEGEVEMTVADNVMDINYQRKLFKEWLDNNKIDVDWDKIVRLDNKVNEKLSQERDVDYRYRNWFLKKLEIDNMLSYGDGNVIEFDKLGGITVVNSEPKNFGGKTTGLIDAPLFLFFNTTTKTKTAGEIFNKFRPDCDIVRVKGTITIDGNDYIIERKVVRKLKRDGENYTVKTDLSFQKLLSDGTIENLEGEQRRETDDLISKSIGTVDDFLLTILTTAGNLETLLETKATERGRLLSRFIGLEIVEDKETLVKEMKSSWSKGLKSDQYNIKELEGTNDDLVNGNKELEKVIKDTEKKQTTLDKEIGSATIKKEEWISMKTEIDKDILKIRKSDVEEELGNIVKKGKKDKEKYDDAKSQHDEMSEVDYDEDEHSDATQAERDTMVEASSIEGDITRTKKLITELKEGEFCSLCEQPLKDVDHTEQIKGFEKDVVDKGEELVKVRLQADKLTKEVSLYADKKKKSDDYFKFGLMVEKLSLDLENMRLRVTEKQGLIKKFDDNEKAIEKNKDVESKVLGYTSKINNLNSDRTTNVRLIENAKSSIKNNNTEFENNLKLVEAIKTEEEVKVIFDAYSRMVGKNGIVKMIMKSVIPLINSELERLLSDTAEFKLIVDINDKQEVEFNMVTEEGIVKSISAGSGYERTVSALALRCVLTKVSCLPKPNMIILDEVFGKVADENLELVGSFFDKVSDMFDNVFLISHNNIIKDWGSKLITVTKTNNVSSLEIK